MDPATVPTVVGRWGPRSADGGLDRVPVPDVGAGLWLCGKHRIGPDHEAVLAEVSTAEGVAPSDVRVVCLVEAHELTHRYDGYLRWLRGGDARAWWHPVHDLAAPPVDVAVALVDRIDAHLRAGGPVVVHCAAGIGRAGTVAAAVLVRAGRPVAEAVAHVAAHRPLAGPEAGGQAELLASLPAR